LSDRPLVSIVMPTYDRQQFLPPAVESIFAQTLRGWELIVADDGSSAPTLEYLAALERDERVRVLRREHVGIPSSVRNAGISEARAPLVAFMDSDDLWHREKLEKQLAKMRARPACRWSYTGFVIVDADDVPFPSEARRRWTPYCGEIFEQVVRGTASIRTSSVIASTELLRDIGGFDERIDCAEDCDLYARLALRSPACIVDEPLVRMRRHRPDSAGTIGASHAGREYSLRKLEAEQTGLRRAVLMEELGRNAWLHASVMAKHLGPRPALATLARSLRFGWPHPRWWSGAAKAAARACLRRLPAARRGPTELRGAHRSPDPVEARLERSGKKLRAGDR
jgi:glycosyltransferase involved in cell wall biosynthesis